MTSPIIGSRPVVGSSKKMISGSLAIARASPTRLRMPPDSSEGSSVATSGPRPTSASLAMAMSRASLRAMPRPSIRPKATFSQTRRLSNKAAFWNSMPNLRRTVSRSDQLMPTTSLPSTVMLPCSGVSRPRIFLSRTDFPVPEPPMITIDSPSRISRSSPSRTTFGPNALCRFLMSILTAGSLMVSSQKTVR